MTIQQARKILGKQAQGIPDDVLLADIEAAELLKNLFFSTITTKQEPMKNGSKTISNVP